MTYQVAHDIIPKFEKFMLKKQVIASILAIALTFYSGSLTFASAATQSPQTQNPMTKTDFCSGFFPSPLCGKIDDICIPVKKSAIQNASVISVPQKTANGLYTITTSKQEEKDKRPAFSYTYDVAMATPTTAPTLTATPSPTVAVQSAVAYNTQEGAQPTGNGLNPDTIFTLVNQIRAQHGLAPFEKSAELCSLASERAPELYTEIFVTGNMHAGIARRQPNLPYRVNENMIHQNTEQQAVTWWMNSSIHRSAILGSYTHACVGCQGNSCAMLFANL
ncbi:MAG TPA: CAP domain-containing protein [Candidatus Levybacteria bacterium]|nr:CAP domain-containing protein [Candidatus Levybacteria bacterium]